MKIIGNGNADSDVTEVPTEPDSSLKILNVQAQFRETTGLRYRAPESNAWRAVRRGGDAFYPPLGGWGDTIYAVVVNPSGSGKSVTDTVTIV